MNEARVKLELLQDDQTFVVSLKLSVRSTTAVPPIWVDITLNPDSTSLREDVKAAAEALARHLGLYHMQNIDPADTARAALDALEEVFARAAEARRT
jgi:hypothetical protein